MKATLLLMFLFPIASQAAEKYTYEQYKIRRDFLFWQEYLHEKFVLKKQRTAHDASSEGPDVWFSKKSEKNLNKKSKEENEVWALNCFHDGFEDSIASNEVQPQSPNGCDTDKQQKRLSKKCDCLIPRINSQITSLRQLIAFEVARNPESAGAKFWGPCEMSESPTYEELSDDSLHLKLLFQDDDLEKQR